MKVQETETVLPVGVGKLAVRCWFRFGRVSLWNKGWIKTVETNSKYMEEKGQDYILKRASVPGVGWYVNTLSVIGVIEFYLANTSLYLIPHMFV